MFTIGRLGLLALAAGSGVAALSVLYCWATFRRDSAADNRVLIGRIGWAALVAGTAGGWLATITLAAAFAVADWRFVYVTDHARPDVGWPLRISGIWAGPEGSLLLWTTMAATAAMIAALEDRRDRRPTRKPAGPIPGHTVLAHSVATLVAAGHSVTTLVVANPFQALAAPPAGGTGLQPVLEHPAMVWHPPLLYAGLLALMIPAGLAISMANSGRNAGPSLQRSLLWASALLTAGLATGANWAYVELGWGGYWAWDPIENAGLIAWLLAVAVIHRLARGQPLGRGVTVLAVLPALAALWATTITRTGVLSSVHSFANQPGLRAALLAVAGVVTIAVLMGPVLMGPVQASAVAGGRSSVVDGDDQRPRSRSGAAVLLAGGGLVAIGTYQPVFAGFLGADDSITGPSFYGFVLLPVVVVGALARSGAASDQGRLTATVAGVAGALIAMIIAGPGPGAGGLVVAAAGGAVVGAMVATVISQSGRPGRRPSLNCSVNRSTNSQTSSGLSHIGIGLLLIGAASSLASTTDTVQIPVGVVTPVEPGNGVAGYDMRFDGVELVEGGGVQHATAQIEVDGRELRPSLVSFVANGATSVETATDRGWWTDIQVSLVDADANRAIVRISRHPGMNLIWLGAAMMTLGLAIGATLTSTRPQTGKDEHPATKVDS